MLYTLKNDVLTVKISDTGAELSSVKRGDCEYIWQPNAEFWSGQAPNLFPICGRLFEGKYTFEGTTYKMDIHGFLRHSEMTVTQKDDTNLTMKLKATKLTKKCYPFAFAIAINYSLKGDKLTTKVTIENKDKVIMPATFGAHPGFNIPLDKGNFSDYYLEFGNECAPDELVFSTTCFNTGYKRTIPLKDAKILALNHHLFDIDGVFMSRIADTVTLKSNLSERSVTLHYPDMPYLGIWHKPRSEAPYMCIEPWCGLPSFDGQVDDFSTKCDMFRIPPKHKKVISYDISFK